MTTSSPRLLVKRVTFFAGCLMLMMLMSGRTVGAQVYESLEDTTAYFKARVLDSLTREPVIFAHIVNRTRQTATISDTLGYFYIRTSPGDRLELTAIGYATRKIIIGYGMLRRRLIGDVLLRPFVYSIEGVRVNPLGSYAQFKRHFITLEIPESEYTIHPSVLNDIEEGSDTLDMLLAPPMSPVTALYNLLSKEGKSKRKLRKLQEQEAFEKQIDFKYSPDIVSQITGYTGFELYEFMDFCSFEKDFLLYATYYEITRAILARQTEFEANKLKKDRK
jgi:hypothetical protein